MTAKTELREQMEALCIERGIDQDELINAMEVAIASAYRKEFGNKDASYEADYDLDNNQYSIYRVHQIVDEVIHPDKELSLVEARLNDPSANLGDEIREKVETDKHVEFGRIASQIAKQVLVQAVNAVRHNRVLSKFKEKVGDIVSVEIDYFRKGGYIVKLAQTQCFLAKEELLPIDRFKSGQVVKALVVDITEDDKKGSKILLSRAHPDFVKAVIKQEIPEVEAGIVVIDKIVREPGNRTKVLVSVSEDENQDIDPVGTILGRRNVRILNIMREISTSLQEKIDIIEKQENNLEAMIADALEPAEIEDIKFEENEKGEQTAIAYCYPEEAALAVGKRGTNVRLASKLLEMEIKVETIEDTRTEDEKNGASIVVD